MDSRQNVRWFASIFFSWMKLHVSQILNTSFVAYLAFWSSEAGGGKSTYLQTLAQLVILAQIGCFLPAHQASLRVMPSEWVAKSSYKLVRKLQLHGLAGLFIVVYSDGHKWLHRSKCFLLLHGDEGIEVLKELWTWSLVPSTWKGILWKLLKRAPGTVNVCIHCTLI